jgi:virginiamycin B lyase
MKPLLFTLLLCASASGQITEYAYPTAGSSGGSVSYDSTRQVVWFALDNPARVCKSTSAGTQTCFNAPSSTGTGSIVYNPGDDRVYLTEQAAQKIAQFNPNTNTFPNEWTVPDATGVAGIQPFNGKLYFVEPSANKVGIVDTSGNFSTSITVGSFPHGPTIGLDGNFWFCLNTGNQIGKIDTSNTYTAVTLPQANSGCGVTTPAVLQGVNQECFTENSVNKVGCLSLTNQTTGGITQWNVPTASADIWGITTGSDGNLYFGERAGNKIGLVIVANSQLYEYAIPAAISSPNKICLAFNNWIVFTEHVADNLAFLNVKPAGGGSRLTGKAITGKVQ